MRYLAIALCLTACGGGDLPPPIARCDVTFRAAYLPSQQGDIRLTEIEEADREDLLELGRERADEMRFGWSRYVTVGPYFEECP